MSPPPMSGCLDWASVPFLLVLLVTVIVKGAANIFTKSVCGANVYLNVLQLSEAVLSAMKHRTCLPISRMPNVSRVVRAGVQSDQ